MVKKVNAVCGLAVSVSVLIHIVYVIYAYLTFYYNPLLTRIIADTTLLFAGIHIIFSAVIVFVLHDRGNGMLYPRLNMRTLVQRVSAVLMILMLVLHINTFKLLASSSESNRVLFAAVMISQVLFFASALLHVALSAGNALITLGAISTVRSRKTVDVIVWIICAVLFTTVSVTVLRTELIMFGGGGVT